MAGLVGKAFKITWNRGKNSWKGKAVKQGRGFGGDVFRMTLNRDKNSWKGEAVK